MNLSPEQKVQFDCVTFTHTMCPTVLLSASQNGLFLGGSKNVAAYIRKMKLLGLLPGELDLMLTWPGKNILFVELKAGKNDTTDAQDKVIYARRRQGFDCDVAWTLIQYHAILKKFNVPIRSGLYAGIGQT